MNVPSNNLILVAHVLAVCVLGNLRLWAATTVSRLHPPNTTDGAVALARRRGGGDSNTTFTALFPKTAVVDSHGGRHDEASVEVGQAGGPRPGRSDDRRGVGSRGELEAAADRVALGGVHSAGEAESK